MGFDYRTSTGLEKQILGGHKQNCVCTRTQEKGAVTPQETEPDLSVSVKECRTEVWATVACHRVRGTEYNSPGATWQAGILKEATITTITPIRVGPVRREHSPTHRQKIRLKIYWAQPHLSEQDQIPPQPVPPIRKLV